MIHDTEIPLLSNVTIGLGLRLMIEEKSAGGAVAAEVEVRSHPGVLVLCITLASPLPRTSMGHDFHREIRDHLGMPQGWQHGAHKRCGAAPAGDA